MSGKSTNRIKGDNGVIIDSDKFLELPKAPTKITPEIRRSGMIRYNNEWRSFEGAIEFTDGTISYRRFAHLDDNGRLLMSQLPDFITSGVQYIGTFDPIIDDIDPPRKTHEFLPNPSASIAGHYYIVRGVYNSAFKHYQDNKPTSSPVIFSIDEWSEIKYYFELDDKGHVFILNAFCRLLKDKVPTTQEGLTTLIGDDDLTDEFSNETQNHVETQLMDGDWVICTPDKWLRLRQTRTSITASSVMFDRSVMYNSNRIAYDAQSGSVQDIIDSGLINGFRRSGDAMMDTGSLGEGRFAAVYGDAGKPAITFNNKSYSPDGNPGHDPSKWSDNTTGLFHPVKYAVGITTHGFEKFRVDETSVILYQKDGQKTPILKLSSSTNDSDIGFYGVNNSVVLEIAGNKTTNFGKDKNTFNVDTVLEKKLNVNGISEFDGNSTFNQNIDVVKDTTLQGNTTIGTDCSTSILDIKAKSIFNCDVDFKSDNITVGKDCTSNFTVNAASIFNCNLDTNSNVTFNLNNAGDNTFTVDTPTILEGLTVRSDATFNKSVEIGEIDKGYTFTVKNKSFFEDDVTFEKKLFAQGEVRLNGNTYIGDATNPCTTELNVYAKLNVLCDSKLNGTLVVEKSATFNDDVKITTGHSLTVDKDVVINNDLVVKHDVTTSGGKVTLQNDLVTIGVDADSKLNVKSELTVDGKSTFNKSVRVNDKLYFDDTTYIGLESNSNTSKPLVLVSPAFKFYNDSGDLLTMIDSLGINIPHHKTTQPNSVGTEGTLAYDETKKMVLYKDDTEWKEISSTKYINHKINRADWVQNEMEFSVDIPNPKNYRVLSVQLYENKFGVLRIVIPEETYVFDKKIQLVVNREINSLFSGFARVIMTEDVEDFELNDKIETPSSYRISAGTTSFIQDDFVASSYFMIDGDDNKYPITSTTTELPYSITTDTILHVFNTITANWFPGLTDVLKFNPALTKIKFNGATTPFTIHADLPKSVTSLKEAFKDCKANITGYSEWDVSGVDDMSLCFSKTSGMLEDISDWDVSNVITMANMFSDSDYSPDLSEWDISSVRNTSYMFHNNTAFDGDISNWNTTNVTNMYYMFAGTSIFNNNISTWNVSNVITFAGMFSGNIKFDKPLSSWILGTTNNITCESMFRNASEFNQNLNTWNTIKVTDMSNMFSGASKYNQDMNNWNLQSVTDFQRMFINCSAFNGDVSTWVFPLVKSLSSMFFNCINFNQDISGWDVSNITNMNNTLYNCTVFNQNISTWDTANVTNMDMMFYIASNFVQDISSWNVVNIPTKPNEFDYRTNINWTTGMKPVWGTDGSTSGKITPKSVIETVVSKL